MSVLKRNNKYHIKHQYRMWIKLVEKNVVEVFNYPFGESDDSIKHTCYLEKIIKNFKS